MKKLISERRAALGITMILVPMICFHLLILLDIIPYKIVWGGKLNTHSQVFYLELISLLTTLVMLLVVCLRMGWFHFKLSPILIQMALWVMVSLFTLNTLGNITSPNLAEKILFAPLTLTLALLCCRLALSRKPAIPLS